MGNFNLNKQTLFVCLKWPTAPTQPRFQSSWSWAINLVQIACRYDPRAAGSLADNSGMRHLYSLSNQYSYLHWSVYWRVNPYLKEKRTRSTCGPCSCSCYCLAKCSEERCAGTPAQTCPPSRPCGAAPRGETKACFRQWRSHLTHGT